MQAITLRNIPSDIAQKIRQKAMEQHTSINKAVILLLAESLGLASKRRKRHEDLDSLSGRWGREEAQQFKKALASQRTIDSELWG